jgi:AraC family transcriptional regulator
MKVMVIVKASKGSEAGELPSTELLAAMGSYNEQLAKAGIMLDGAGLTASSKGARVRFSGSNRTVVDGPFLETKELIAGFWVWRVKSLQEAIDWVKKCPNPMNEDSDIEIRPFFEAEDFGEAFTPELREQEAAVRATIQSEQNEPRNAG